VTDLDQEERAFPAAKILAVDDNAANLLALAALLEPLENHLVEASSGPQALELASQHDFAVILLDVMMPVMDGFETLARLRTMPTAKDVPVVLLTAFELDPRALARAHKMGAVDYILKPLLPELLRSKVAALVSLHRRGEEIRRRGAALAAKDRDIAMLAHDLQNPLTTIETSANWLQRKDLDPGVRKAVERISRASSRMTEMIRSLTDYARAGRGAIPVSPTWMDLRELCSELVDDARLTNPSCSIELLLAGELKGAWDRNRLHQAISNLVGNAIKYGAGKVEVQVTDVGPHIEVAVHNGGVPIASDLLPVIFQPFERGADTAGGLGLGLFIVREIAKAHDGDISVSSSASGTTFVLRLPRGSGAGVDDPGFAMTSATEDHALDGHLLDRLESLAGG
jgi:signal transduction histidine kinase